MIYSQRLGEIAERSFQIALKRFGLGELVAAEAIPYGLFGQNVFLRSTRGEYVFRGNPLSPDQFENERFAAERLHAETDVPVPWPYRVDESGDPFGWPFVIMPRLPGLQLASPEVQAQLSAQDRLGIAEAMGVNLAHMHQVQQPRPGLYDAATRSVRPLNITFTPGWLRTSAYWNDVAAIRLSPEEVYRRWIFSRIDFWMGQALESSDPATGRITPPEDVEWVATLLDRFGDALLVPFPACFVMNDYKEGNTVAAQMHGRWQITGVFDLMEVYFGDGEADLSRNLAAYGVGKDEADERPYLFLDAYFRTRGSQAVRPGFVERFAIYLLMDRLILWSFGRKIGWFDGFADFRAYCEPYLRLNRKKLPGMLRGASQA